MLAGFCDGPGNAAAHHASHDAPVPVSGETPTAGEATSSSTATSHATQDQAQSQGQGQSQQASADNANNASQSTRVDASQHVRQSASSAMAPVVVNVASCAIGGGVGVQANSFGLSLGGARIDEACNRRANSQILMQLGERDAAVYYLAAGDADIARAVTRARQEARIARAPVRPTPRPAAMPQLRPSPYAPAPDAFGPPATEADGERG